MRLAPAEGRSVYNRTRRSKCSLRVGRPQLRYRYYRCSKRPKAGSASPLWVGILAPTDLVCFVPYADCAQHWKIPRPNETRLLVRVPAHDLQTKGIAAVLASLPRQPDGQNPSLLCRVLRSACVIRGKRIGSPPNGLIWAVGYFVERSRGLEARKGVWPPRRESHSNHLHHSLPRARFQSSALEDDSSCFSSLTLRRGRRLLR